MTPSTVARFMASLFPASTLQTCRLLDAGAGLGALSCAFLDRWISADGLDFQSAEIDAYEIDKTLRARLETTLASYAGRLPVTCRISAGDFIWEAACQSLGPGRFTHAILNPPYKKINSASEHRLILRQAGIETVNFIHSVLQKQDNAALARVYVQEGVNAFPDHLQLNKILVNLNIRERRFGAALERIEKCGVQDAALLTYRGLCRFHLGDFDRAMADFRSSLGWDGAAVENYYYMGLIFDNRKEYPQALLHYRRFLELNPENRYFRHRQWIVERMQMLQKAFNSDGRP